MCEERNYRGPSGRVTRGKQDPGNAIVLYAKALSWVTAHFDRIPSRGISPLPSPRMPPGCQAPKSWVQYVPEGPPPA